MRQRRTFLGEMGGWGVGSEARDMTLPSLRNLGAKFSEMSFLHLTGYYLTTDIHHHKKEKAF